MTRVKRDESLPEEDRFDCPKCDRSVRKKDRARHMELHAPENETHWIYCPYFPCTVRVRARFFNNICQHVRSQHTRVPLKCPVCDDKGSCFETYQDGCMSRHFKKSHPGVKPPRWGRPEMPVTTPEQQAEQHRLYLAEHGEDDVSPILTQHKPKTPKQSSLPGMSVLRFTTEEETHENEHDTDQDGEFSMDEDAEEAADPPVQRRTASPFSYISHAPSSPLTSRFPQKSPESSFSFTPGHAPPRMIKADFGVRD